MPYRRTERVREKLAARREELLAAATVIAAEQGLAAVQVAPVAQRAGIAAGTIYRYFPGKSDLVIAVLEAVADAEVAALKAAGAAAPGPLSALAAVVVTFAQRSLAQQNLIGAALGQPHATASAGDVPSAFQRAVADEFAARIRAAAQRGVVSDESAEAAATAMLGAVTACTTGPDAQRSDPADQRKTALAAALFALRLLGIKDARARGLIMQAASAMGGQAAKA